MNGKLIIFASRRGWGLGGGDLASQQTAVCVVVVVNRETPEDIQKGKRSNSGLGLAVVDACYTNCGVINILGDSLY